MPALGRYFSKASCRALPVAFVARAVVALRRLPGDRRGNVSLILATCIVVLLGIAGLALEYGMGLMEHMQNQRTADAGAFAAATVYNSTASSAMANAAVNRLATLNSLTTSAATPTLANSPSGDGNNAYKVSVTTSVFSTLSHLLSGKSSLPVTAPSYAEIGAATPGCILALSQSQSGITVTGAGQISAPTCTVASNTVVSAPNCSGTITAKAINYGTTYNNSTPSCSSTFLTSSGSTPPLTKKVTPDPIVANSVTNAEVTAAYAQIATAAGLTAPANPTTSTVSVSATTTTPLVLNRYSTTYVDSSTSGAGMPSGCSATFSSGMWTLNCTAGGTYTFYLNCSNINNAGLNFNPSSSSTYIFYGGLNLSCGNTWNFGPGTYKVSGDMNIYSGSGTATFAGSAFYISGNLTESSGGTTTFSNASTMQIGGNFTTVGTTTLSAISTLSIGGALNASSTTTIMNSAGTAMTVNIASGICASGTTTLGAGTYGIGSLLSSSSCGSSPGLFSVYNQGSGDFVIGGSSTTPSTFNVTAGFYTAGSTTLCLGHVDASGGTCATAATTANTTAFPTTATTASSGNIFNVGPSSNGYSLYTGGSSTIDLGDASTFDFDGNIYIGSGSGNPAIISAAANHYIKGYVNISGGTITLGAGVYVINGYLSVGGSGGSGSLTANNVSIVLSGASQATDYSTISPATGDAFVVGAALSPVTITAPVSGNYAGLAVIGPPSTATYSTSEAHLTSGSSDSIYGVLYFPNGPVAVDGANKLNIGTNSAYASGSSVTSSGSCLQIIGSTISVSGSGGLGASSCFSSSSGSSTVVLVQ